MKQYVSNLVDGAVAVAGEAYDTFKKSIPVDKKRILIWFAIGAATFAFAWARDSVNKKIRKYGDK